MSLLVLATDRVYSAPQLHFRKVQVCELAEFE